MFISVPLLCVRLKIEFTIFSAVQPPLNLGTPRSFSISIPETSTETYQHFLIQSIQRKFCHFNGGQSCLKSWITDTTYFLIIFFFGKLFPWLLYGASWKKKCTRIMLQSWYKWYNQTQSFTIIIPVTIKSTSNMRCVQLCFRQILLLFKIVNKFFAYIGEKYHQHLIRKWTLNFPNQSLNRQV